MAYQRKDRFYRQAKGAGYRSRAAYKLLELAQRHRLVRRGDHVVDLGAWPGGWLQVAAELAGREGRVVGVDVVRIDPLAESNVVCLQGDVREPSVRAELTRLCGGRVDVVLSDMAPKLTGVRSTDEARAAELAAVALALAGEILRPGGRLLLKTFMNRDTEALVSAMRSAFREVTRTRPEASRAGSAELYLVGSGFTPSTPRDPAA